MSQQFPSETETNRDGKFRQISVSKAATNFLRARGVTANEIVLGDTRLITAQFATRSGHDLAVRPGNAEARLIETRDTDLQSCKSELEKPLY